VTDGLLIHATAVAIDGQAVLLRGPPGAGKSDLALRLIDGGARLISDDQAVLYRKDDQVLIRAPATIAGLIEVRGLGILRIDPVDEASLGLLVDLVSPVEVERLPDPRWETILGVPIPLIALAPFEPSAAAKLRLARRAFSAKPAAAILR
jgi:serine kinase of HPr protein (carbohydrate metabolism regulator)